MSDWKQRLAICRRNLGSRTGEFWRENHRELEIGHESPLDPGDPLNRLWRDQELLFTRGDVQLAALVMANTHLFHRAWVGAPAVVVHGSDPAFEEDPDELLEIAQALDDLRSGPAPADPELATLHARLVDEYDRTTWTPVPASIAGRVPCHVSTLFLHRGAMPDGWVADSMFPILALREQTPALALLPSRYWPEELVRAWRSQEPAASSDVRTTVDIHGYGWPVPAIWLASFATVSLPLEFATGNENAIRELDWPMTLCCALAGISIFLFDRYERRPAAPRYFGPVSGAPIEVRFHRRFLFLKPRTWAWLAFAAALLSAIVQAVRR
jgi:hypothetical protein